MGKTRFAFELAEKLKQQGWKAGQMLQPDAKVCYEVGEQGLLLIIDYPEEQGNALATLVKQLARMEMPETIKLRILLLSRRDKLAGLPGELDYRYDPPYALAPLNNTNDFAWQLFQSALQTMQQEQKEHESDPELPLTQAQFEQWLEQNSLHSHPLFILAFALHLLNYPDQHKLAGADIIRQLVARESRRLREEANSKGMDADGIMLLKALSGITGGINKSVLEILQTTSEAEVDLPTLRSLSQSSLWDQQSLSIPPLQPDLLAAQLLQNELDKDYLQTGKWLYQSLLESDENRQREAIDRLGRLIFDYHYTFKSQQQESSREKIDLVAALVQTIGANQQCCQTLKTIVYMKNLTQPLLPLAIAVSKQMIDTCEDKEEQALLLNNLSNRLAESGQREQGLAAIRRSVEVREQLAEQNVAAYAPDLAGSLNNLSVHLAESSEISNALSNSERAVEQIKPFAKPGTLYADWQQAMQTQLARLKGK